MAQIGIFYGSSTGKTEAVAYQLKDAFDKAKPGLVDIANIGSTAPDQFLKYSYLICGIPTWNTGLLQDDWAFFLPKLEGANMEGKKVAIFGLGDQNGYGFNFLDAVGILADDLMDHGAELWGMWGVSDYQFNESRAQVENMFLGLGIDEDGQGEKTLTRLGTWVQQVVNQFEV
ncbi:MAG: flavodoxin [Chloroflexota bacterium]|nr:flavodoxin [Chloroflexota bacterium]